MGTLTIEDARSLLHYDPDRGTFTRLTAIANQKAGAQAGSINIQGYVQIRVLGKNYLGHRLALFLVNGFWPQGQVDHINRDRADNRLCNLRVVTPAENKQNCVHRARNKAKTKGVHFCSRTNKWVAQIAHGGIRRFLGRFPSLEDASLAYAKAAHDLHKYNPSALTPDGTFIKEAA